ncbi:MAG TPA: AbgT family transporter [Firmicutes bacterium]|nr:AbgT family transporter [Bacillota bacterium]
MSLEIPRQTGPERKSLFFRFLDFIERVGNQLPDPLTLFAILAVAVLIISYFAGRAGLSVIHPGTGKPVAAVNLLTADGIRKILASAVTNFTGFPPLGLVLVIVLGVGLAEGSGLFAALLRKVVLSTPTWLATWVIVFMGIQLNAAGDSGFVVLPPVAGAVYASFGRHPLVGMMAGYAAVAAGFSANLTVNSLDALIAGITQSSARLLDPNIVVNPAVNWYFLAVSSFVLTVAGVLVTERIVEPRFGRYQGSSEKLEPLKPEEEKALKAAGIWTLVYIAIIVALCIPPNGLLRNPKTGSLIVDSGLMNGLVPLVTLLFFIPGYVYGKKAGTIKTDHDLAKLLNQSMATMGGYIVLAFVIGQFIAYFNWSNLGLILAISGANFLKSIGLTGLPLMLGFIVLSTLINLFVGSASAKWSVLGPVFVPMLMLLGYSPAFTQVAYRIGDSCTNAITPLLPYFVILLGFAKKYDENIGMGTLIAGMLPYSIVFLIVWCVLFTIWTLLGLPLGPGGSIFL